MRLCAPILLLFTSVASAANTVLSGPQLKLSFDTSGNRFRLLQIENTAALLYSDGPSNIGNRFAVVIRKGPHAGIYMPESFHLLRSQNTANNVLAYLESDKLPLQLAITVDVEGSFATWRAVSGLAAPFLIAEGGGHGIALLDDNRSEYAADPGACAQRGEIAGNHFPLPMTSHKVK